MKVPEQGGCESLDGAWACLRGKRVLLLQGPMGPFFRGLAQDLAAAGAIVHKVNFNGGDKLFYWRNAASFKGTLQEWPYWLRARLREWGIEVIVLFGDCRPVHRCVDALAREQGCVVGVFEEGYLRPHHVTFELHGVNGHSGFARDLGKRMEQLRVPPPLVPVLPTFWHATAWSVGYVLAAWLSQWFWNHDLHHRRLTILEGLPWLRSAVRKQWFRWRERGLQKRLTTELSGRYFLVPLQVFNDSQVDVHSQYEDVPQFIAEIIKSFAQTATARGKASETGDWLVFKHHPMDRGYVSYTDLIARLAKAHGVGPRVLYIHDQHLPTLLNHAKGVVVINSTVGLSALQHGTPTLACGSSIYDVPGLTFQGDLRHFWSQARTAVPDKEALKRFTSSLIACTQLNGSFYRFQSHWGNHSGVDLSGLVYNLALGLRSPPEAVARCAGQISSGAP
ncbi:MAG: capsular biosynthesis protein [Acidovorax sp.]|uniref:capsule biosynthesis protein n=1 Tax=Acidovorax sp. TaxID=1872122 RepID=UPI0039E33ED0